MAIDVESYYREYGPMVLRRCRRLLADEEAAMDAMQDTFVQLLRYKGRLKETSPASLLFRIATNVCLNIIRARGRWNNALKTNLLHRIAVIEESEPRIVARSLLGRLFSRQRVSTAEMAVMHLLDGMTFAEVAERTNMSQSGVRKRLAPLRAELSALGGGA